MSDIYCPVCGEWLKAENEEEVKAGEHCGFVYVHKDVKHSDSDIAALGFSIQ